MRQAIAKLIDKNLYILLFILASGNLYGQNIASIQNPSLRINFVKGDINNQAIACQVEINVNGIWRRFLSTTEDHKIYLLYSEKSVIEYKPFFPAWNDSFNPYESGNLSEAIPVKATNIDDSTIEVQYLTQNGSSLSGRWTLPREGNHIEVRLSFTPSQAGMHSIGLAAFQAVPETQLNNVLLPPMFQYKRVSPEPVMLLSSMMQQPLAITEAKTQQGLISSFISGDNTTFPKDWGSVDHSPMGFSLKNQKNEIQPVAFAPILGMQDSEMEANQTIERKFIVGILPKGWNETIEYISDHIYKVKDYRKQQNVSLTETTFNILDLMRNKEYGGWDSKLKGFYDIEGNPETVPTVVHSAPLAVIAASVFSNDEEFYLSHALPTIEYTLSRSGYRWAIDVVPTGYNRTLETLELNPFKSQFNTTYYEGLHHLLGDLNPWLTSIALPGDTPRKTKGYSSQTLSWVQALSAYRMTGDEKWLKLATSTADRYINTQVYTNTSKPLSEVPFYNSTFYAPWWDLLDLYEITNEEKYLNAAKYGASHTIAGIRNFPAVDDHLQTIHPDNKYDGNTNMWWKGKNKYRLGFPRVTNDVQEKEVPEWIVSAVGLGFEQPFTYFLRAKGKLVRPVFMSSWAPHLLRLYHHTQKPIYQTYARNAVIGRFTNYPGYYATGYTDITLSKDFPYKGPDVSSIYYHHIPPHLAFTWDYLVSEAIERSKGNIDFPYAKQEGFVWFANRIYGNGKGKVFGDNKAKLWMKKGLIEVDNPTVNYITAISDKNFWIIVSNESDKDETLNIHLSSVLNLAEKGTMTLYTEKGKIGKEQKQGNTISQTIAPNGFKALAIPLASSKKESRHPVLKNGMKVIDMNEPFGKIFLFRIRSPFGWDSIYGFAETPPVKGEEMTVQVECNGQNQTISAYPFEWSFYKLKLNEKVNIKITVRSKGQKEKTKEVIFNAK